MKQKINIFFLFTLYLCQSYSQINFKDSLDLNNFTIYKVDKLNGSILKHKKTHAFIDYEKDTVFYINIGLCESIFLTDYLHNNKTLKSKHYLYNDKPAYRELDKDKLAFYKSCLKKTNSKNKFIIKPLWKLEAYEKYFTTINYLTDSEEIVPDSIKSTMKNIKEIMFSPYSDEEITPWMENILANFEKCNYSYRLYFKERFALVESIFREMELKFNNDPEQIKQYRKTQIIKNSSHKRSILIIQKNEEDQIYQLFK